MTWFGGSSKSSGPNRAHMDLVRMPTDLAELGVARIPSNRRRETELGVVTQQSVPEVSIQGAIPAGYSPVSAHNPLNIDALVTAPRVAVTGHAASLGLSSRLDTGR